MIVHIGSDGRPVPADAIRIPAGIAVKKLSNGRILIGGQAATGFNATQALTRDRAVTDWVSKDLESTIIRMATVTELRTITRERVATVTRIIGTFTDMAVLPASTFTVERFSGTKVNPRVTREITREVTRELESTVIVTREVTRQEIVTDWKDKNVTRADEVSRIATCATGVVTDTVSKDVTRDVEVSRIATCVTDTVSRVVTRT